MTTTRGRSPAASRTCRGRCLWPSGAAAKRPKAEPRGTTRGVTTNMGAGNTTTIGKRAEVEEEYFKNVLRRQGFFCRCQCQRRRRQKGILLGSFGSCQYLPFLKKLVLCTHTPLSREDLPKCNNEPEDAKRRFFYGGRGRQVFDSWR